MKRFAPLLGLVLAAVLGASAAQAQTAGTITFAVEVTTQANGTVTPKATWSTTPAATSCTASSGWTGTKTAAGNETLAPVSKSTNYKLDCTWGSNSASLRWTPPTQNTDGSTLTDLAGYRVYYGTSATATNTSQTVTPGSNLVATVSPLSPGTWYFNATAFTTAGAESLPSPTISKSVGTVTGSKSVALAVNIPNAPTGLTVE